MNGVGERLMMVLQALAGIVMCFLVVLLIMPLGIISGIYWIFTGKDHPAQPLYWMMDYVTQLLTK